MSKLRKLNQKFMRLSPEMKRVAMHGNRIGVGVASVWDAINEGMPPSHEQYLEGVGDRMRAEGVSKASEL